ncbi:CpaE family protein [Microbacterium paludicola]|uniref:CpaE family protein n=1 Tax=Microbacterium paludicola TaxID=300019 RepID=UPI003879F761
MIAIVAAAAADAERIAEDLRDEGVTVLEVVDPAILSEGDPGGATSLRDADTLILAGAGILTAALVAECDRLGVRILLLVDREADVRAARAFGLAEPLPPDAPAWRIVAAARGAGIEAVPEVPEQGRVVVVWGPEGAPGRTTLAIELALEHARLGAHVALLDADTHAPSIAIAVGLADESPGLAAACRQAEFGLLDAGELLRVSVPLADADGRVDVLTGINRVSRWPELSGPRMTAALAVIREWADVVIVDVSASLEADEEIVSDLDGPRRNAATLAALAAADQIVAVAAADPVGLARLVRGYAELRRIVGATPVRVVVNRLRSGPLGIDPRGQVRRALERFSGVTDVSFVPDDRRASDAALLAARPVGEVSPRSALAQAVRRLAAELQPRHTRRSGREVATRAGGGIRRRIGVAGVTRRGAEIVDQ